MAYTKEELKSKPRADLRKICSELGVRIDFTKMPHDAIVEEIVRSQGGGAAAAEEKPRTARRGRGAIRSEEVKEEVVAEETPKASGRISRSRPQKEEVVSGASSGELDQLKQMVEVLMSTVDKLTSSMSELHLDLNEARVDIRMNQELIIYGIRGVEATGCIEPGCYPEGKTLDEKLTDLEEEFSDAGK